MSPASNAPIAGSEAVDDVFDAMPVDAVSQSLSDFFEDPSRFADPFALFRRLRTLEPVHWSRHHTWVVTGHLEARSILHHPAIGRQASAEQQFGRLAAPGDPPEAVHAVDIMLASLINRDPPDHTRLRRLVAGTFTPKALVEWRPRIEQCVVELVDDVASHDEFDFLHELAYRLPERIICELLDVPVDDLRSMSLSFGSSRIMTVRGDAPEAAPSPSELRAVTVRQMAEQVAYFRDVVERRKRAPGSDLISALALAEEAGDRLSMDELVGTVIILIGAGHETTANLVANGMLALLRNPGTYRRFRSDPAELVAPVLEEVLRYASPSPGQPRTALAPIDVAGRTIPTGEQIFVILNAANRDPRVFAEPERFDIDRPNNRDHVTFTEGIHHCLGSALARLEAGALLRAVAERLGPLELVTETLTWRPTYVRSLTELHVRQTGKVGR